MAEGTSRRDVIQLECQQKLLFHHSANPKTVTVQNTNSSIASVDTVSPLVTGRKTESKGVIKDWQSLVGKPVIKTEIKTESLVKRGGLLYIHKAPIKLETITDQASFDINKEGVWPSISSSAAGSSKVLSDWTSVVKRPPPVPVQPHTVPSQDEDETIEVIEDKESMLNVKKSKKKKNKSSKKRLDTPLTLELSSVIDALQQSKVKDTLHKITTGTVSVPPVAQPIAKLIASDPVLKGGGGTRNALDSSAPTVMRGKERETPKKKKPSSLRKVIDKEKEERKRILSEGKPIPTIVDKQKVVQLVNEPPSIHNRKFREYCTHLVTEKIDTTVESLLGDLAKFQDRVYKNDPTKYKAKRRFVCGLREVKKHLGLKNLKCIIVPPNLQRIQSPGGIDDTLNEIIEEAKSQSVPLVFSMTRRRLARILKKKFNIGCVGILSCAGAEDKFKRLLDQVRASTDHYHQKVRQQAKLMQASSEPTNNDVVQSSSSIPVIVSTIPPDPPLESDESLECEEYDDEDDDMDTTDTTVPVSQWRELFDEQHSGAKIPVLNTSSFTWNLEAPEFMPLS